jgi:hypothetical protein
MATQKKRKTTSLEEKFSILQDMMNKQELVVP